MACYVSIHLLFSGIPFNVTKYVMSNYWNV